MSLYDLFGLDPQAELKDIKAAYHKLLLQSHPDKASTKSRDQSPMISDLLEAYAILSDSTKRAEYDLQLKESCKQQGYTITGSGLDTYTLIDFDCEETESGPIWLRDCPRCTAVKAIELLEADLESGTPDGLGGYHIVAGCLSCSLWIVVAYEVDGSDTDGEDSAACAS